MTQSPVEKAEAARIRRRWINLGELLAIAAVVISALTLWNSYRERTNSEAEHRATSTREARAAATLTLKAKADKNGDRLDLTPLLADQTVQSQTIRFPDALGLDPIETTGDPRIERRWLETAVAKARKAAGLPERTTGDARLPLLLTTRYIADGDSREDVSLYDLGYATEPHFLSGTNLRLRGLSLVRHGAKGAAALSAPLR